MWDKIAARNIGLPMCRTVREQEEAFATSSRLISLELPSPDAVKVARNSRTLVPNSTIDDRMGMGLETVSTSISDITRYYGLVNQKMGKRDRERKRERKEGKNMIRFVIRRSCLCSPRGIDDEVKVSTGCSHYPL